MALPIAQTPILKGKDAEEFIKLAEDNSSKKASEKEALDALKLMTDVLSSSK